MSRARRRKKRIGIAVACCLPTVLLALVWALGAAVPLLQPGRALPERSTAGFAGSRFHVINASGALPFTDLPQQDQPPALDGPGAWGRRLIESRRAAGVFDVARGVEWQGSVATYFTLVAIPMWLPMLCTLPLLAVAAWELYRVRASSRGPAEGVCPKCGHAVEPDAARCAECGRLVRSVDPVGQLFLAGARPASDHGDGSRVDADEVHAAPG